MGVRAAGIFLALIAGGLLSACQHFAKPDPHALIDAGGVYNYPLQDPVVATVIGTPEYYRVALPREVPIDEYEFLIYDDRPPPAVFWYEDAFRYSLAAQRGAAPLLFIVAGTNAGHSARLSVYLQKLFYMAGFHVVSLSSPTYPNFVITASSTSVPGRISQDASDLYRAMQMTLARVKDEVEVTDVNLAGYSLGAWQSAFLAKLDAERQGLGFRKVLLINPPVSLYRSSNVLDRLLTDNLPGGIDGIKPYIDTVLARFTEIYERSEAVDFSQDFIYRAYQALRPADRDLAALIGISFRLSSANIAFTADVMSRAGFLVPRERVLTPSSSLTPFFDAGMREGFVDYFDGLLYPYYRAREPGLSREAMIEEASLESISPFLARAGHVGLVTSADDIILAPGDIDLLRRMFGVRATIFPTGGHCGNMEHTHVAATYLRFLTE